eukprot:TRINITY_DN9221_c0_g2_i1.p1 TRINITY_DN9221_c0_g2~~TRINITY_DN9221_c0_g2_i1.p1  ORF type:complete len:451 (+),score=52.93 TRINITY_DN9221_c0_g2_i1:176-1354(+)
MFDLEFIAFPKGSHLVTGNQTVEPLTGVFANISQFTCGTDIHGYFDFMLNSSYNPTVIASYQTLPVLIRINYGKGMVYFFGDADSFVDTGFISIGPLITNDNDRLALNVFAQAAKYIPPTNPPTNPPTDPPTNIPTNSPTNTPTNAPTNIPTNSPTNTPTTKPPTSIRTTNPPTFTPTMNPPTPIPTTNPPTSAPKLPSLALEECSNSSTICQINTSVINDRAILITTDVIINGDFYQSFNGSLIVDLSSNDNLMINVTGCLDLMGTIVFIVNEIPADNVERNLINYNTSCSNISVKAEVDLLKDSCRNVTPISLQREQSNTLAFVFAIDDSSCSDSLAWWIYLIIVAIIIIVIATIFIILVFAVPSLRQKFIPHQDCEAAAFEMEYISQHD